MALEIKNRPQVDFDKARKVDLEPVLKAFAIQYQKSWKALVSECPLPQHTGKKSMGAFCFYLESRRFKCHQCGKSGDVIDFIRLVGGIESSYNAAVWLLELTERAKHEAVPGKRPEGGTGSNGRTKGRPEDVDNLSQHEKDLVLMFMAANTGTLRFLFRKLQHQRAAIAYLVSCLDAYVENSNAEVDESPGALRHS